MDAQRWERVQAIFHDAIDVGVDGRVAFVAQRAGGDATLARDVLTLLEEDAQQSSMLDGGVARVAHAVFERHMPHASSAIGPYWLGRLLGEGGMGVVYLAERADLGSTVAIKMLRDALLSPSRRERFVAEQRLLAQLNHPGIAHLLDAGTLPDGTPWIAMEYVDGVYLTEYCSAHARTLAERLALFRQVCDAVQHAHSHLVIHRDIKPSNVLVDATGTAKLLDFGIAKQLADGALPSDMTQAALRLMTPAYASPEQLSGGQVGTHTDVYALGVVLYELLTGQLPFDIAGKTPTEVSALVQDGKPARPSSITSAASATRSEWVDLDVLCLTAMHRDPAQRYRTVDALIRDIDHFLKNEPLEARPDSWGYRAGKFVQRKRTALAIGAMVFVVIVGLTTLYTVRLAAARNVAIAEAARAGRIQRFMLTLMQGGDDQAGPADSLRVLTIVERGAREAASLDAEPAVQAELYQTLGGVFARLGRLDRADTLLAQSLQRRRDLGGAESPEIARTLVAQGLLRVEQARMVEAESLVRAGLLMTTTLRPALHPDVADATTALGKVLEARGTFAAAIPVLQEAVRLQEARSANSNELAKAITSLADNHFYAGHHDAADSLYRRGQAMARLLHGDQHPLVGDGYISLGAVRMEKGDDAAAEAYDRKGLAIIEKWFGPDDPRTASAQTMLARALMYEAQYDDAAPLLAQSLATQERLYGPVHPKVASALNELGNVAVKRKRLDEADARFTRMADIYRTVYGDSHYLLGIAIANRGGVALERKDPKRAEALFREALAVYGKSLAPTHMNFGITRLKLGRSLARQRRWADALREIESGYAILSSQASPSVSWLQAARKDLAMVKDSLGLVQ
ncbi:MAG: tetratricopeptide repeat protein [bacterium]